MSVVMPFAGTASDAAQAVAALATIARRDGDQLLLVDNSAAAVVDASAEVEVVRASAERSSYHARNVGASRARNDWLLFIDSDCRPLPEILDAYFAVAPGEREGALAGEVDAEGGQTALAARYARSRGYLSQQVLLEDPFAPHAVTANMMVRRRAWESVGGFAQGIRSGGDSDFSWRLQQAGWQIGHRPAARVVHRHRESARAFLRVATRYGAGRAWLRRRHPGSFAGRPGVVQILRSIAAAVRWLVSARLETAAFRALDGAVGLADLIGEQLPNRATPPAETARAGRTDLFVMVDTFPALSETFVWAEVQALARAGFAVRVEAMRRPVRQEPGALSIVPTRYVEDDSRAEKLVAVCWLVARHPLGCARDLIGRRRWKQSEEVLPLRGIAPLARRLARERSARLYCHFAAGAALNTMRIALLSRRPYALTAHAYDIFRDVRNLVEKLERAELVFTGCEYNVRHLRELVAPDARDRIHEVVMGVDPRVFRRTVPYPGGRRVIGAGRLVEKKGFADLIAAVARLEQVDELVIAGDGPLRSELQALAHELGIEDRVRLAGALEHRRLRDLLEHADVLAMPCVVASDGDRDSMPVVVKEALSLEIPVVATDEVGLPELVREPWGRLVPPHDPDAIAEALAEVLSLPAHDRIEMGRAGRAHVLEHCNVDREAAKLASLLSLTARASGSARKP